jgi:hypothetical protein
MGEAGERPQAAVSGILQPWIVSRTGERAIVQCKNSRAWTVREPVLRDLSGAMHGANATKRTW